MRTAVPLALAALAALGALTLIRLGTNQETLAAGGLLLLVSLPCVVLSRKQLGAAFSVGPQAKGLVTQGLYARIPHPMYVFLDLALLAAVVMLRQPWLLVAWVGLIGVQAWQARREATALERAFGHAYREYRRRTWW